MTEHAGGGDAEQVSMETIPSKLLFAILSVFIFGGVVVGAYVFIRIYRPDGRLRRFLCHIGNAVKDMMFGFAELIRRIFGFKFVKYTEAYVPMSYHEERISISDVSIRGKSQPEVKNYSEFRARLERLTDPCERYTYAYATMMMLARSRHSLKASNTPREATAHLLAQGWDEGLPEQTENYEFAEYSLSVPSSDKLEAALEDICVRIRTML